MHSNLSGNEREQMWSFAEWTLNVGNGRVQGYSFLGGTELDWIEIPEEFLIKNDTNGLKNLIEFVYPGLVENFNNCHFLNSQSLELFNC